VENDGMHAMLRRSGDVYLGPGRYPLRLLWFNGPDRYGLRVSFQGPGLARQSIPDSTLFRTERDLATGLTNMINGLDYRCYEGRWVNLSAGFGQSKPVKAVTPLTSISVSGRATSGWAGVQRLSGSAARRALYVRDGIRRTAAGCLSASDR